MSYSILNPNWDRMRKTQADADMQPPRCAACGRAVRPGRNDPCECTLRTPLPWSTKPSTNGSEVWAKVHGPTGEFVADCNSGAVPGALEPAASNAKFIVRACNSHDELVAALQRMVDDYAFENRGTHFESQAVRAARAALAKATGK